MKKLILLAAACMLFSVAHGAYAQEPVETPEDLIQLLENESYDLEQFEEEELNVIFDILKRRGGKNRGKAGRGGHHDGRRGGHHRRVRRDNDKYTCMYRNAGTNRLYHGTGRTKRSAQHQALTWCNAAVKRDGGYCELRYCRRK